MKSKIRFVVSILFGVVFTAGALAANLLTNPKFESIKDGVPEGWIREAGQAAQPLRLADDSVSGRKLPCLESQGWIGRTHVQRLMQKVALKDAKALAVTLRARGQGIVVARLKFLQAGNIVSNEVEKYFVLGPQFLDYRFETMAPAGADAVELRLGNVLSASYASTWSRALVDEVTLEPIDKLSEFPAQAADMDVKDLVDIAPFARVRQVMPDVPPEDGERGIPEPFIGVDHPPIISLTYPEAQEIRGVRLNLRGNAVAYIVRGDKDGDGRYETVLVEVKGGAKQGWASHALQPVKLRGIQFQPIAGGLAGYRSTSKWASEIQVYAPKASVKPEAFAQWRSVKVNPSPAGDVGAIQAAPCDFKPPALKEPKFKSDILVDMWMLGLQTGSQMKAFLKDPPNYKPLLTALNEIKAMDADWVTIFQEGSGTNYFFPWPSKVSQGIADNVFKATVDVIHAQGLKVNSRLLHCIVPYEVDKFHYPHEETSRYPDMQQFDSLLFGKYFRTTWLGLLNEQMDGGLDGINLAPDEYYYKGHLMGMVPPNCPSRAEFKKRFGYDNPPDREADTEIYRKWVVMNYEGVGELFGYFNKAMKRRQSATFTHVGFLGFYNTPMTEGGVAWDIFGKKAQADSISCWGGAYGAKLAVAANGYRKAEAGITFFGGKKTGVYVYGNMVRGMMYGAGYGSYYRHNYITDKEQKGEQAVKASFDIVRDLEALGAWDARPPRKIAVLIGRASADWWQLKAWYGNPDPDFNRGAEGLHGTYANQAVNEMLLRNGYPYDLFYSDQLAESDRLGDYKVIVLPFPYALSKAQAGLIRKAAAGGTRVLAFERMGEVDEWGNAHKEPALKDLFGADSANVFYSENLMEWGRDEQLTDRVLSDLNRLLGDQRPLVLKRYGRNIEAAMLEKSADEIFLMAINWELDQPSAADLGLSLPDGKYDVFVRDLQGWQKAAHAMSAADLKLFRVPLAAQELKVFYIVKQGKRKT